MLLLKIKRAKFPLRAQYLQKSPNCLNLLNYTTDFNFSKVKVPFYWKNNCLGLQSLQFCKICRSALRAPRFIKLLKKPPYRRGRPDTPSRRADRQTECPFLCRGHCRPERDCKRIRKDRKYSP